MSEWVGGKGQSSEIDAQMCRQLAFHKGTETILWGQQHCFNSPRGTGYLYEEWKLQTPTSLYVKNQQGERKAATAQIRKMLESLTL